MKLILKKRMAYGRVLYYPITPLSTAALQIRDRAKAFTQADIDLFEGLGWEIVEVSQDAAQ